MKCNRDFDLIVIGGGPAGATVSTLVAMNNHRVLLLERERFPRYQIGESLLPATVHGVCAILGVSKQLEKAKFVRKHGGTFLWGRNPKPWTFAFDIAPTLGKSAGYSYQVERMKFDRILLDNARHKGVEVREGHTVTGLTFTEGRVSGVQYTDQDGNTRSATAQFVADASGHQTVVGRTVGDRVFSKNFQNIAMFCYFEGGKRLPSPNDGNILCASFQHGWFWYIPLSQTLTSVGAVIPREHAGILKDNHESAMERFIRECPIIADNLSSARRIREGPYGQMRVRKDYSYCHTKFWAPGVVLIGDAACFIDPVFSSGVHLATYSALLAARSINSSLRGNIDEERCFVEFELRYRKEFNSFYQFLLAFYDTDNDELGYFTEARKMLNTEEAPNEAFVRLVAGIGGSGESVYGNGAEHPEKVQDRTDPVAQNGSIYLDIGRAAPGGTAPTGFMMELLFGGLDLQRVARRDPYNMEEGRMFPGGLVPSKDGLRWHSIGEELGGRKSDGDPGCRG